MTKKINKVARYQVSVNELQKKILEEMMAEDFATEVSDFFCAILVKEYKHRQEEKSKRPVGRPRKEYEQEDIEFEDGKPDFSDDLPKNINWYGTKIGKKELAYYENLQKDFQPKG